jgi:hypothetical protein
VLTPGQRARDTQGAMFFLDRAKTGRAAAGTLTPWSEQILESYIAGLGVDLLDNAPIFRTAGSVPGPTGGRRWLPQPYTTSKMDRDFREVRAKSRNLRSYKPLRLALFMALFGARTHRSHGNPQMPRLAWPQQIIERFPNLAEKPPRVAAGFRRRHGAHLTASLAARALG